MRENNKEGERRVSDAAQSAPKIWTAVQHGSGLVAVLGVFLAFSAYSTDPQSGLVTAGLGITLVGLVGFGVGWWVRRRSP